MSAAIFDTWKQNGVKLERTDTSGEKPVYFISVPSISDFFDDKGNELSGMLLAKRVKRDLGDTALLRCRVRQEHWTQAKAANAEYEPQKQQAKPNVDDFVRAARYAEEKRKEDNYRAFFEGLFGGNYGK